MDIRDAQEKPAADLSAIETPDQSRGKPSVFVVAYVFPPVASIGYKRPLRLVNHLARKGYDVTVYAAKPSSARFYHPVKDSLADRIAPGVTVIRTSSWQVLETAVELRNSLRARLRKGQRTDPVAVEEIAAAIRSTPAAPLLRFADAIMDNLRMPDQYMGWTISTLPRLVLRSLIKRPRALYVTAPPWSALVLASLAGRILRIPIHLDYRDPWSLNPYLSEADTRHRALENWILGRCSTVTASTERMAEMFRKEFVSVAQRVHCVYNAVDHSDREAIEMLRTSFPRHRRGSYVVAHVGTLYSQRMPLELARTFANAAETWTGERDLRFRFVGPLFDHGTLQQAFRERGIEYKLELVGNVPPERAKLEELHADVLLLLQSGSQIQVPAKLFEYALIGNPILCIAEESSEVRRLVDKYRLGEVIGSDGAALAASLQRIASSHHSSHPRKIPEHFIRDFDETLLAERMRSIIGV